MEQISRFADGVSTEDIGALSDGTSTATTIWQHPMPKNSEWAIRIDVEGKQPGGSGYAHFEWGVRAQRTTGAPSLGTPYVIKQETSGSQSAAFSVSSDGANVEFAVDDDGTEMRWVGRAYVREVVAE